MIFAKKQKEADVLCDDLKRKISEAHLAIRSGELSPEQLATAEKFLLDIKKKIREQANKIGVSGRAAIA